MGYIQYMAWLFRTWLPIAIAVTGVCGLIYVSVQQSYIASLNDPQIRMAHDAADSLDAGKKLSTVVPSQHVAIDKSLASWIAVYDKDGTPLATSGQLFSATPTPPIELLTVVHTDPEYRGENQAVWKPYSGVSQALVIVASADRIVVSGRNMHVVEERIWRLGATVFAFWILTILAVLVAARFGARAENDGFTIRT